MRDTPPTDLNTTAIRLRYIRKRLGSIDRTGRIVIFAGFRCKFLSVKHTQHISPGSTIHHPFSIVLIPIDREFEQFRALPKTGNMAFKRPVFQVVRVVYGMSIALIQHHDPFT